MTGFENNWRRKQEIRMRPVIDCLYRRMFGDDIEIKRVEKSDNIILDREHAIDVQINFSCGVILLGQEKALSYNKRRFRSVTVEYYQNPLTLEKGDWFKLASQFYFVGYCTKDDKGFLPWIMLNWPNTVLATHRGELHWRDRGNRGKARATFKWLPMDEFPALCVMAKNIEYCPQLF